MSTGTAASGQCRAAGRLLLSPVVHSPLPCAVLHAVGKRLEEHERILADAFTAQTRAERIVYSAYGVRLPWLAAEPPLRHAQAPHS